MPSRIIKETIIISESLTAISAEAERFFWRLVVKADDFGLYYGDPRILASLCFPQKPPSEQKIRSWLNELVREDMVGTYTAPEDGKKYLKLLNWGKCQQTRAKSSKYPEPSSFDSKCKQANGNQMLANVPVSQGIDFLGFRTYLTDSGKVVRKVRRESKNRIRRKITKFRHLVDEGRVDFDTVLQSYNSWTGHAEHGNSYHLISEIDDLFFNLFREEMEGKPYGEISIRFARWKRRQVGEHKVQRTGDPVDRRHTGHVPGPNGPGDGTHDHPEMLRREGAEQQQQ